MSDSEKIEPVEDFDSSDCYLSCPFCGEGVEEIGCEKTTTCDGCGRELKYGDGQGTLDEVEEDDPIYWDR